MPDDARWAIAKVERHIKIFERLIGEWSTRPVLKRPVSRSLDKERIVNAIKNAPDGIMTQAELLDALGWYKCDDYYRIRETLIEEGKIRLLTEEEIERLPIEVRRRHGLLNYRGELPKVFSVSEKA